MEIELFLRLFNESESNVLDFKKSQYKLINDKNEEETARFVKDVVCFSNTIREKSSYIIIGVEDFGGEKKCVGLDIEIDEAVFQSKIENKVYPKPVFKYSTLLYDGKKVGVLEFPVTKYEEHVSPVVKMKGLEVGKVYFRRGSMNSEANGREIIQISDWLRSLRENIATIPIKEL